MKLNFLVSGTNKVIDDMGRSSIATRAAKPLAARQTLDNTARRMDSTVSSKKLAISPKYFKARGAHLRACM
jgi:hypothetical protein